MCKRVQQERDIMNLRYASYAFVLALIITGCTTSKQQIEELKTINEFDNAPSWIKAPQIQNYISETGSSSATNETFNIQRDAAIEDAKANLSQKIRTKLINIFSSVGQKYIEDEDFLIKIEEANNEITSNAVNESRVMKLWKSNKENIYVMVSSNTNKLKDDLKEIIDTSFKDYSLMSAEYRLQLEQGNIDIELNN